MVLPLTRLGSTLHLQVPSGATAATAKPPFAATGPSSSQSSSPDFLAVSRLNGARSHRQRRATPILHRRARRANHGDFSANSSATSRKKPQTELSPSTPATNDSMCGSTIRSACATHPEATAERRGCAAFPRTVGSVATHPVSPRHPMAQAASGQAIGSRRKGTTLADRDTRKRVHRCSGTVCETLGTTDRTDPKPVGESEAPQVLLETLQRRRRREALQVPIGLQRRGAEARPGAHDAVRCGAARQRGGSGVASWRPGCAVGAEAADGARAV